MPQKLKLGLAERLRLRKKWRKIGLEMFPGLQMLWDNGVLGFLDGTPVPGIPHILKQEGTPHKDRPDTGSWRSGSYHRRNGW